MKQILRVVLWAGVAAALGRGVVAWADTTYPGTTGTVDGISGTGTLYAQKNLGQRGYTIVGIEGPGVTGLIAPGEWNGNDDELFPKQHPVLSQEGFAFTDTMGDTGFKVQIYGNSDGSYGANLTDSDGVVIDGPASFSLGSPVTQDSTQLADFLQDDRAAAGGVRAFSFAFGTAQLAATPEPSSMALFGTGLLGAAALAHRRVRR